MDGLPGEGSCKKPDTVLKYTTTTAGVMIATRPCGYVVGVREMFSCESCSQWLLFLLELVEDMHCLAGVIYDRACELHPFIRGVYMRMRNSGSCDPMALERLHGLAMCTKYRVDKFHVKSHKPLKCMPPKLEEGSDNGASTYHPQSVGVEFMREVNDSMAESVNRYYSLFNHAVSCMGRERFNMFVVIVTDARNRRVL